MVILVAESRIVRKIDGLQRQGVEPSHVLVYILA